MRRKNFRLVTKKLLAWLCVAATIGSQCISGISVNAAESQNAGNSETKVTENLTENLTENVAENTTETVAENTTVTAAENIVENRTHGYVDSGYRPDSIETETTDNGLAKSSYTPAKYDSRDYGYVTPVRSQGSLGTCWAFASVAAMESYILSHNLTTESASALDLSEYNLAYMAFDDSGFTDPLGGTEGDNVSTSDMLTSLNNGGNDGYAYRVLSKWAAVVGEENGTYPTTYSAPEFTFNSDDVKYILTGMKQISMKDRDLVKQAVMENGAVATYYYDDNAYYNFGSEYFNYYYNYKVQGVNHAVTIVGWDDTKSKEDFAVMDSDLVEHIPEGDGAWLIKNSWGTNSLDGGYMWISYYDVSNLNAYGTIYEMAKKGTYDYNYQYDGSTTFGGGYFTTDSTSIINYKKYANVFTVPEGMDDQVVSAVSFATRDSEVKYSIQIYKNPSLDELQPDGTYVGTDNPESGTAMLDTPVTGQTTFAGYYTISLSKEVNVSAGDTFAVVITFDDNVELEYSYDDTYYNTGSNAVANNQSYIAIDGENLVDTYNNYPFSYYKLNLAIKAFTRTSSSLNIPEITDIENGASNITLSIQNIDGAEGYDIFRKAVDDADYIAMATTSGTEYIDNQVEYGKTYTYKVRAYATINGKLTYTDFSQPKTVTCEIPVPVVSFTDNGDKTVTLSWDKVTGAAGYNVYKSTDGVNFTKVADNISENSYTDGYLYNRNYYYEVSVNVKDGDDIKESNKSGIVKVNVISPSAGLKCDDSSYGKITFTWTKVDDVDKYVLRKYNEGAYKYEDVATFTATDDAKYVIDYGTSDEFTVGTYQLKAISSVNGEDVEGTSSYAYPFYRKAALANLAYTMNDAGNPVITWDAYSGTIGYFGYYYVYISDNESTGYKFAGSTKKNSWTYYNYDSSKTCYIKVTTWGTKTGNESYFSSSYAEVTAMQDSPLTIAAKVIKQGWQEEDGAKVYYVDDVKVTGFQEIEGTKYYFDTNGAMKTGWQSISSKWYYFDTTGAMQTGWQKIDNKWYYFDTTGVMQKGWQSIDGKWYYFNTSGVMKTGWQSIGGKWYYFNGSGVMKTGWQSIGGKWYYFNTSGVMQTGWVKLNEKWYYFNASGVMQTGWQTIGDNTYYFTSSGTMVTGWQKIGGTWYCFGKDGVILKNQWVGNYYIKEDGTMAVSEWVDGEKYYVDENGLWVKNAVK